MANLAGKPAQLVIFNDPTLKGRSSVSSVTSEAGAYAGPVSPGAANLGKMLPLQSGRLTDLAVDVDYLLNAAGGADAAEFVWREDGATPYLGTDDARRFHQYHVPTPFISGVGSDNCGAVFATAFRRILAFNVDDATDLVTIASRDIDTTRYDEWSTLSTFTLTNPISPGHHSLAVEELTDGTIMLAIRTGDGTGSPANDVDVYHSTDGGSTFVLVSTDIFRRFTADGTFDTHDTDVHIKLAVSGEWIQFAFVDTGALIRHWISSDRGITWKDTGGSHIANDNGDPDDPIAYDIVGVDDNGSFLLAYFFDGGTPEVVHRPAFQDSVYQLVTNASSRIAYPAGTEVKAITLTRVPGFIYEFSWYSDDTVAAVDHWRIRRSSPADYQNWTSGYETSDSPTADWGGVLYNWGRPTCVWAGNRMFYTGSRKDTSTGIDIAQPCAFYTGGWTERSFGDAGPNEPFDSLSAPLMEHAWSTAHHRPDSGAGSPWTETTVGTTTRIQTQDNLSIVSTVVGPNDRYYSQTPVAGTGNAWGFEDAVTFGWVVQLDSGDGSQTTDECHVRFNSSNDAASSSWAASVRHGPAGITLRDHNAPADLLSLSVDMDGVPYIEVRWTVTASTQICYLAAFNPGTDVWVVSAASVALTTGGAIANKLIRFGMLGAGDAKGQRWRELWVGDTDNNQQDLFDDGNPDGLFGHLAVPGERYYIEHGLHVSWSGAGGALGDTFDGVIAHRHPVENIFVDSPRLDWRSGGANPQAANTIILDAGTNQRFHHEGIALFGINGREILIDYDDNVGFASPTTGGTVVPFRFGGSFFTVASTDGTTLTLSDASGSAFSNDVFVPGEALDFYVRPGNGSAIGLTWKITRHDRLLVLHFDDETVDLASQGLAAGNLVEIFCSSGAVIYSVPPAPAQFMRLRFGVIDTDTAEGDHRLGTIVAGTKLDINVPMDWAFTDNEQPNVTHRRTRGAVSWAYQEGPNQRTIIGRIVGDVTQRFRDRLRFLQRAIGYEVRPIALVLDDDDVFQPMLCKQRAGSQQDNAMWYVDSNGIKRTAGDQSLTFVEEV